MRDSKTIQVKGKTKKKKRKKKLTKVNEIERKEDGDGKRL